MNYLPELEQLCEVNNWQLNIRYDNKKSKGTREPWRTMGKWFVIVKVKHQWENYKAYDEDLDNCLKKVYDKLTLAKGMGP